MKKIIYSIVFAAVATISISACTEQNIKPRDGGSNDCGVFGQPACPPKIG